MEMNRRELLMAGVSAGVFAVMAAEINSADAATNPTYPLPDPKVMTFRPPQDLQFDPHKTKGAQQIILWGEPNQPGSQYGILQKYWPDSMSHPHFHLRNRYIYVVSGTWWVGSGLKFRTPDIPRLGNVRFQAVDGEDVPEIGMETRCAGEAGKASPMSGGGQTAKRSRNRVPGKTVAV